MEMINQGGLSCVGWEKPESVHRSYISKLNRYCVGQPN